MFKRRKVNFRFQFSFKAAANVSEKDGFSVADISKNDEVRQPFYSQLFTTFY